MKIPVMHDDQHGTAIIFRRSLNETPANCKAKTLSEIKNGGKRRRRRCCFPALKMYLSLGVKVENMVMFDYQRRFSIKNRTDLDDIRMQFCHKPHGCKKPYTML